MLNCSFVNIYQFPVESFEILKIYKKIYKVEVPYNLAFEAQVEFLFKKRK